VAIGVLTPLGITLNPMVGAAAMGFSSVFVVSNALRLFAWKPSGKTAGAAKASRAKVTEGVAAEDAAADTEGSTEMVSKTLDIEGMMCEHCVAHVTEALEGVRGVKNVHVSLEDKNATLDAGPLVSNKKLEMAVADAGYKVVAVR
jgi:Cu2+-exporting ATPase